MRKEQKIEVKCLDELEAVEIQINDIVIRLNLDEVEELKSKLREAT